MRYSSEGLYENSIDFINTGLSEYLENDGEHIKSSVKNLYCSIELLLKAYILKETPPDYGDTFIYKKINHELTLTQGGVQVKLEPHRSGQTLTASTAIDFINGWGSDIFPKSSIFIINSLAGKINKIKKKRNHLEHAKIDHPDKFLNHTVIDGYQIILKLMDLAGGTYHKKINSDLSENMETHIQEYEAARDTRHKMFKQDEKAIADHIECLYCESIEVHPENSDDSINSANIKCDSCGEIFNFGEIVNRVCKSESFLETHESIKPLNSFPVELFSKIFADYIGDLCKAIHENEQIHRIKSDPDVMEFIYKVRIASMKR